MIRVTPFFLILLVSFPALSQPLTYKDNLTWEGEGFSIKQSDVILEKELLFGLFTKVELISGKLTLIESDNDSIHLLREMKDSENSVPFGKNSWYSISTSRNVPAYQYIEKSLPIKVYHYTVGKSKEKIRQEDRDRKYKAELSKWEKEKELAFQNHKKSIKKLGFSLSTFPFYYDKPKPTRSMSLAYLSPLEEYYLNEVVSYTLELNDAYYVDLGNIYEHYKNKALNSNAINVILSFLAVAFVIFMLRLIVKVSRSLWVKMDKKLKTNKGMKKSAAIAKIAEEEAIREVVRNSVSESDRDDLAAIRKKIADAIDSGDEEKLEYLIKIAERMKNI